MQLWLWHLSALPKQSATQARDACLNPSCKLILQYHTVPDEDTNLIDYKCNCAEPLRFHHGRKLLNTFYTESDPQHPDSHLVLVDTADASKPYTTEAQQIKDAQDAQVEHVEAAAVDSTPASASAVSRSPAADAQAGAINPRMTAEDDNSSSTDGAHLFGLKSDVSDMAQKAADGITDLKHSIADKFHSSESPPVESGTAAVAGHSQVFQAAAHTAAVTSSDAIGGTSLSSSPFSVSDCIAHLRKPGKICGCMLCICLSGQNSPQLINTSNTVDLKTFIASSHMAISVQSIQHCLCSLTMHATW